jgi:hypothetical protein
VRIRYCDRHHLQISVLSSIAGNAPIDLKTRRARSISPAGRSSMKKVVACALFSAVAFSSMSGCGGAGSGASAPVASPPPAAVTGIQTPKSVSVVTAN